MASASGSSGRATWMGDRCFAALAGAGRWALL
jgi:hypothetical protein